jgi:hypothetical protein
MLSWVHSLLTREEALDGISDYHKVGTGDVLWPSQAPISA